MRVEVWQTMKPMHGGQIYLLLSVEVFPGWVYDRAWCVHVAWLVWKVGFFGKTKTMKWINKQKKVGAR